MGIFGPHEIKVDVENCTLRSVDCSDGYISRQKVECGLTFLGLLVIGCIKGVQEPNIRTVMVTRDDMR